MINELLEYGADRAITGRELCRILNIDRRRLQILIERERREGYPICANTCADHNPGYYLASDQSELDEYAKRLWKRAGELHKTRRMMLSGYCKMMQEQLEVVNR